MGKYYYKAVICEDPEIYYNENDARNDQLWLWGDDGLFWKSEELFDPEDLEHFIEDVEDLLEEDVDYDDNPKAFDDELYYLADYWFSKYTTGSVGHHNANKIANICLTSNYWDLDTIKMISVQAEVLSILSGTTFICGGMKGSSQGDWCFYMCPESLEDSIPWIESVIMGTGTELLVSDEPLEFPEEFEEANIHSMYTDQYNLDKAVAEECGCTINEVEEIKN